MFFRFVGMFFFLGLMGFGVYLYTQYLESSYRKKEAILNEQIKVLKRQVKMRDESLSRKEQQLATEYRTLKKRLEDKFAMKAKAIKKKYENFDEIGKKVKAQNQAAKKDLIQREKGLQRLRAILDKKEKSIRYRESKVRRKLSSLKNIKMECKIFDLRKIDDYIKEFQTVAYATKERVNIFCGFEPSNRNLADKDLCVQSRKDREKARSLLSLIYSTARNVKQKNSYREFVRTQRYRMQITR